MAWVWGIYLAGVLVGLALTDGRLLTRVSLALLWPIGPAAFVLTVTILLLAGLVTVATSILPPSRSGA